MWKITDNRFLILEMYIVHIEPSTLNLCYRHLWTTSSVPNYMNVLIGTKIWRNLWRNYKNAQLWLDLYLNQLSNELFCNQNKDFKKKDMMVWSSEKVVFVSVKFSIWISCFYIKMYYNLCHSMSKSAKFWNLG
jgi:hypothetical protein